MSNVISLLYSYSLYINIPHYYIIPYIYFYHTILSFYICIDIISACLMIGIYLYLIILLLFIYISYTLFSRCLQWRESVDMHRICVRGILFIVDSCRESSSREAVEMCSSRVYGVSGL